MKKITKPLWIVVFFVWSYNYGIQKEWEKQQQFELLPKLLPLQLGSFHLITKWLNLLIEGWQFEKWHYNTNLRWKIRIHPTWLWFKTSSTLNLNFILGALNTSKWKIKPTLPIIKFVLKWFLTMLHLTIFIQHRIDILEDKENVF